ncbi:nitroreductase family protein [Draconibacterium sp. IB214405]|uniref:nitroreductase family protein n=1 Tax=Draconibacterium sp. IB214405 TaxID=3097352 RepID=UPI002A1777AD|nr:nitroreductase family protein [Draconibacterium sp. IB214405]MDX8340501.1 nitroreductase family protein [Draconibacterium sp. IB214405]
MIKELITRNRSYRRFDESVKISTEQLLKWIELASLSASGRNAQPLKYAVITNENLCSKIFPFLGWAGYLSNWKGPAEGERPVAYIAVIKDRSISENHYCDDGIAMQSILLGAVEDGFGGCMIGSVNKSKVARLLKLEEQHELLWIIALGKPAEEVVLEQVRNNDIKYWRDEAGVHHVPKRSVTELVLKTE